MVFKKDLTPLSKKGTVTKHAGKGAKTSSMPPGQGRSRFPKPAPAPVGPPAPMGGSAPMSGPPAPMSGPPPMGPGSIDELG